MKAPLQTFRVLHAIFGRNNIAPSEGAIQNIMGNLNELTKT